MKILLTTLNSKFIHTNLAIRYIQSYAKDLPIEIEEFTINQNIDYIVGEIYKKKSQIVSFSTYIWNIKETLEICKILKKVNPKITIILGGPEVSYDGDHILKKYDCIDYIIYGEGELTFNELCKKLLNKENIESVKGILYKKDGKIIKNKARELIENLDIIPSPYTNKIENDFKNKIVYYESSRGCPFNCQFCLSSSIKGLRFFSLDRVLSDLDILIKSEVSQVKFVDRTFNAKKDYAMAIMNFIMDKDPKNMNFHFEVTAHLLDKEMLQFIKKAKPGLFQFEIGVQSTNENTLKAVGRNMNFITLSNVVKEIKSYNNIHQHLDLIAGLPYEDYESFKKSFNDVYGIGAEKIQLGFLKLLKGSGLRRDAKKYGLVYSDTPPYEILYTDKISFEEILRLKMIEDMVDKYHNEDYFINTVEFIIRNYFKTAFDFFEDLSFYWEDKGYHSRSHSRKNLYKILQEYYISRLFNRNILDEFLKYDYLLNHNTSYIPFKLEYREKIQQNKIHDKLKEKELLNNLNMETEDIKTKDLIKEIQIENFNIDIENIMEKRLKVNEVKNNKKTILFYYKKQVNTFCINI